MAIRRALTVAIGLAGIAAVVVFLNPSRIGSALEHFQLVLIGPIVLLSVFVYILQGIRWHFLLTDVGTKLRLRDTILINLAGQTITAIVPLGDLTRAAFASAADGTDFGTVAATVTVQELSYMLWLILAALPAILALGYGLAAVIPVAGTQDDGTQHANFYVMHHTTMPAVLIETAFVTNPGDVALLRQPAFLQNVAQGIANGVKAFAGKPASPAVSVEQ